MKKGQESVGSTVAHHQQNRRVPEVFWERQTPRTTLTRL